MPGKIYISPGVHLIYFGGGALMRVLLVSHTCFSRFAGQPRAIAIAHESDIDLSVIAPERWVEYGIRHAADVPYPSRVDWRFLSVRWVSAGPAHWHLHWYPALKANLERINPDILDIWEEPWSLVSFQTIRLVKSMFPSCRIVQETEQNIYKLLPFPFHHFRHYSLRYADYAIGRNKQSLDVLRQSGYSGDGEIIPNGVDTGAFKPMNRMDCRLKWSTEGFTLLYLGRLVPEKGLEDLLSTFQILPEDIQLRIVGDGPMESWIKDVIHKKHLASRIIIHSSIPWVELPSLYNSVNALVLPSRTVPHWKEQFGRVLAEAMACGLPVVGSDSGAIPEVLGDCGLIYPEGNISLFKDALMQLRNNSSLCLQLGERGVKKARNEYSWDMIARKYVEMYRKHYLQISLNARR
jgi:glycosyltransferase involved in cell wall biosynthesis